MQSCGQGGAWGDFPRPPRRVKKPTITIKILRRLRVKPEQLDQLFLDSFPPDDRPDLCDYVYGFTADLEDVTIIDEPRLFSKCTEKHSLGFLRKLLRFSSLRQYCNVGVTIYQGKHGDELVEDNGSSCRYEGADGQFLNNLLKSRDRFLLEKDQTVFLNVTPLTGAENDIDRWVTLVFTYNKQEPDCVTVYIEGLPDDDSYSRMIPFIKFFVKFLIKRMFTE